MLEGRDVGIYYFVFDTDRPSGGEKHSYQHVDLLNAAGFNAWALHSTKEGRHTWFSNETRVIDKESFMKQHRPERDFIVVPEVFGSRVLDFPGKKVIFNKNLYLGSMAFGESAPPCYPYVHPDVVAVLAVSEHNYRHLKFAFPQANVFRMYAHIDCDLFSFRPLPLKKKRIACVDKAREPLAVLIHTLLARGKAGLSAFGDYEFTILRGYSEAEVSSILQESLLLISLSTYEGLQRVVLEAMACGCVVAGYGTGPLKGCLPAEYQFEPDDFLPIVRHVESLVNAFPSEIESWIPVTQRARKMAEEFTRERQCRYLVAAWESILEGSAAATAAVNRSSGL